jgi:hypothetical protein
MEAVMRSHRDMQRDIAPVTGPGIEAVEPEGGIR